MVSEGTAREARSGEAALWRLWASRVMDATIHSRGRHLPVFSRKAKGCVYGSLACGRGSVLAWGEDPAGAMSVSWSSELGGGGDHTVTIYTEQAPRLLGRLFSGSAKWVHLFVSLGIWSL